MNKNICVVTSTRADYSLLKPLIKLIYDNKEVNLQLLVTGSHLCEEFGNTYKAIEDDGFTISEKIVIISDDTKTGIARSMGIACQSFASAFERLKPYMIVLLGDRYEIFAVAGIATVFNIPIAHIQGGETTTGAIDNVFRDSITKMSTMHFTAAEEYREKVIRLGANPENVFFTGSLAVDSVKDINLLTKNETEKRLGVSLKNSILFTYHPTTAGHMSVEKQVKEIFSALDKLEGFNIIMTKSNADAGGMFINQSINKFETRHPNTCIVRDSLGQLIYYSAMKQCTAVVGNSSSGILESPIFKTPTLNIGCRQNGRIMAGNIICVECEEKSILYGIYAVCSPNFRKKAKKAINPFEVESTALSIYDKIIRYLNRNDKI